MHITIGICFTAHFLMSRWSIMFVLIITFTLYECKVFGGALMPKIIKLWQIPKDSLTDHSHASSYITTQIIN